MKLIKAAFSSTGPSSRRKNYLILECNFLMLHQKVIAVCCGSLTENVGLKTSRGDIAEFVFKVGGTCSDHCTIREIFTCVFSFVV
jgi:hypothetical protein